MTAALSGASATAGWVPGGRGSAPPSARRGGRTLGGGRARGGGRRCACEAGAGGSREGSGGGERRGTEAGDRGRPLLETRPRRGSGGGSRRSAAGGDSVGRRPPRRPAHHQRARAGGAFRE